MYRYIPLVCFAFVAAAQTPPPNSSAPAPVAPPTSTAETDPSYRLTPGDSISVNVYAEPEMSAAQRMDVNGVVRLPLIGEIKLGGKSVREAEKTLENLYRQRELLKAPLVSIVVSNYALREVSVLGAVAIWLSA